MAAQARAVLQPLPGDVVRAHRGQERRNGVDRDAVAVHAQPEKQHGNPQPGTAPRKAPVQEKEPPHEEMGEEVAVQGPPALEEVPGIDGDERRRGKAGALAEHVPHEQPEEHASRQARQELGQAGGHGTQAEQLDEDRDQVGKQGTHLAEAPRGQVGGKEGPETVRPVVGERLAVHGRHRAVVVEAARHRTELPDAQSDAGEGNRDEKDGGEAVSPTLPRLFPHGGRPGGSAPPPCPDQPERVRGNGHADRRPHGRQRRAIQHPESGFHAAVPPGR